MPGTNASAPTSPTGPQTGGAGEAAEGRAQGAGPGEKGPQRAQVVQVKPLIRRSSGSTRAAAPAAAQCQRDVSPLVSRPLSTTTAAFAATAVIRHLRTGPAQAKPPQQPLSACARDDGSRGLPTCADAAGLALRAIG